MVLFAGGGLPAQQSTAKQDAAGPQGTAAQAAAGAQPAGAQATSAQPAGTQSPGAQAGESVDTSMTVMGRDDSVLPVPDPAGFDEELLLPPLDTAMPDYAHLPPIVPSASTVPAPPPPYPKDLQPGSRLP